MTTRDSLAELYVSMHTKGHSNEVLLGITRLESELGFKSGWDALAKLVREELSCHGELEDLLCAIEKLVGEE